MPNGFVPLETFLQSAANETTRARLEVRAEPFEVDDGPECKKCGTAEALTAVRRFHAALADAVDASLDALMRKIAREVLGRELVLAPVEVAAIASATLDRYAAESPLRLRAHPEQLDRLSGHGFPVVADPQLGLGDVVVDLRCGTIDARLAARLECALESFGPLLG